MAEQWENVGRIKGDDGKDGKDGKTPDHEWNNTSLRFQNPDDTWGQFVDLKGEKGDKGERGEDGVDGVDGVKGEKGDKGDMGNPLFIKGTLQDETELPPSADVGNAYIIDGDLYVWGDFSG